MEKAALGFRVKSGWAMAVLLSGPPTAPTVIDRRRIELADPAVPDSAQPFHAGLDLPKAIAERTVGRLVKTVQRFAACSVQDLLAFYRSNGHRITAAGIVVGSTVDPKTIKNDHIRAHAEEGRLFRVAIADALKLSHLHATITPEKELFSSGAKTLRIPEPRIKSGLTNLGKAVPGSWRSEEKAATLAAWMALAGRVGQPTPNRKLQKKN